MKFEPSSKKIHQLIQKMLYKWTDTQNLQYHKTHLPLRKLVKQSEPDA